MAGYKAAFLVSIGVSVAAVLVVAVQMRTRAAPKGQRRWLRQRRAYAAWRERA